MMSELDSPTVAVYPYRWVVLLLFCLYASVNFFQFLQYSIITNIMTKYYNVNNVMMALTGLVYMISFILFYLPINYLVERYSLRTTAILSSGLTALGNLLKVASVLPDRFVLVLISQTLCGIAQVFMLSVSSKLASVWFGPNQVSTACAIAIFGTQFGVAFGAIASTTLVKNSNDSAKIGYDLFDLMTYNAMASSFVFGLVLLFFRAKPPLPPSQSQLVKEESEKISVLATLKALRRNKDYLMVVLIFGMSNGIWTAIGQVINTIYLQYFPGSEEDVGLICLITIIVGGCFGSVFFGYILDKTQKFKVISFICIFAAALSFALSVFSMESGVKSVTYFTIPVFGFFLASTILISYEFATELTYPLPESISCSVLNAVIYLFGIIFTLAFEAFSPIIGFLWSDAVIFAILLLCSGMLYFISPKLRRRAANV